MALTVFKTAAGRSASSRVGSTPMRSRQGIVQARANTNSGRLTESGPALTLGAIDRKAHLMRLPRAWTEGVDRDSAMKMVQITGTAQPASPNFK